MEGEGGREEKGGGRGQGEGLGEEEVEGRNGDGNGIRMGNIQINFITAICDNPFMIF